MRIKGVPKKHRVRPILIDVKAGRVTQAKTRTSPRKASQQNPLIKRARAQALAAMAAFSVKGKGRGKSSARAAQAAATAAATARATPARQTRRSEPAQEERPSPPTTRARAAATSRASSASAQASHPPTEQASSAQAPARPAPIQPLPQAGGSAEAAPIANAPIAQPIPQVPQAASANAQAAPPPEAASGQREAQDGWTKSLICKQCRRELIPGEQIFICSKHTTYWCQRCKAKTKDCTTCKQARPNDPAPLSECQALIALALSVAEGKLFKCPFKCNFEGQAQEVTKHLTVCPRRVTRCPRSSIDQCRIEGPVSNLAAHLVCSHGGATRAIAKAWKLGQGVILSCFAFSINDPQHRLVEAAKEHFLVFPPVVLDTCPTGVEGQLIIDPLLSPKGLILLCRSTRATSEGRKKLALYVNYPQVERRERIRVAALDDTTSNIKEEGGLTGLTLEQLSSSKQGDLLCTVQFWLIQGQTQDPWGWGDRLWAALSTEQRDQAFSDLTPWHSIMVDVRRKNRTRYNEPTQIRLHGILNRNVIKPRARQDANATNPPTVAPFPTVPVVRLPLLQQRGRQVPRIDMPLTPNQQGAAQIQILPNVSNPQPSTSATTAPGDTRATITVSIPGEGMSSNDKQTRVTVNKQKLQEVLQHLSDAAAQRIQVLNGMTTIDHTDNLFHRNLNLDAILDHPTADFASTSGNQNQTHQPAATTGTQPEPMDLTTTQDNADYDSEGEGRLVIDESKK